MYIVPRYAYIKSQTHSIAAVKTQGQILRVENEIIFFCKKKKKNLT
jgi:hypothetical protein